MILHTNGIIRNQCDESNHNVGDIQSTTVAVDERENRPKSLFGSVRNRRSILATPAGDSVYGRKSSASVILRDMGRSSKDFFSKLTMRKKGKSPPLPKPAHPLIMIDDSVEYDLRVAFIGNQQCGKEALLS